MFHFHFQPLFISYPSPVLTQIGVTDTPSLAQPEAAWTEEVEDQHVIEIGIENARKETEKGIRKGIERENEIMKEIKKMKETLRFYLQYLRKLLL